jgi:hypothetical protein
MNINKPFLPCQGQKFKFGKEKGKWRIFSFPSGLLLGLRNSAFEEGILEKGHPPVLPFF